MNHIFFLTQDLETGVVSLEVKKNAPSANVEVWKKNARQYSFRESKWGSLHLIVDQQTGWLANTEIVFCPTYETSYLEEILDDILAYRYIKRIIRLYD